MKFIRYQRLSLMINNKNPAKHLLDESNQKTKNTKVCIPRKFLYSLCFIEERMLGNLDYGGVVEAEWAYFLGDRLSEVEGPAFLAHCHTGQDRT